MILRNTSSPSFMVDFTCFEEMKFANPVAAHLRAWLPLALLPATRQPTCLPTTRPLACHSPVAGRLPAACRSPACLPLPPPSPTCKGRHPLHVSIPWRQSGIGYCVALDFAEFYCGNKDNGGFSNGTSILWYINLSMRAYNMYGTAYSAHIIYIWKIWVYVIMVFKGEKEWLRNAQTFGAYNSTHPLYPWEFPHIRVEVEWSSLPLAPSSHTYHGLSIEHKCEVFLVHYSVQVSHCRWRLVPWSDPYVT